MGKVTLAISLILVGLSSYGQTNQDVFKFSDYVLVRTDSSSRGLTENYMFIDMIQQEQCK